MVRRQIVSLALVIATLLPGAARAQLVAPGETSQWRDVVTRLEPAAYVAVRLKEGARVKGTVLAATEDGFTLKPHTRIPIPAREIRYADVASIERTRLGMSPGMKVLIGAGAGVGGFLLLVAAVVAGAD